MPSAPLSQIEESEVTDALSSVYRAAAALQAVFADDAGAGALKYVSDYLARLTSNGGGAGLAKLAGASPPSPSEAQRRDPTLLAEALLEGISLLEAVTVSPVFVCVIATRDGVPALLRTLGVVSVVRHISKRRPAGAAGGGAGDRGVLLSVAEEVLARTCNTLAHMARVAYEIEGGHVVGGLHDHVPGPIVQSLPARNWFPA